MIRKVCIALWPVAVLSLSPSCSSGESAVARVAVAGNHFILAGTGETFTPWGFNYVNDWDYRLIEDYWGEGWQKVEQDLREIQALGANVVRICLQYHEFMDTATTSNEANLSRLKQLVTLAERLGIYLDITGLGSFRPKDEPAWYVELAEPDRWAAQAKFWETIAATLAGRPGVFAFNLMNEPIVAGEQLPHGAWVHPNELEGLHYLEYINLDPAGKDRADIAVAWIRRMKQAIRSHDPNRLVTVGMFPLFGSTDAAGFPPGRLATEVDFISVHLYPRAGRIDNDLALLRRYDVGLPVLIEETFPLSSGIGDYRAFLNASRALADGWLSFYWGETDDALRARGGVRAGAVLEATKAFEDFAPTRQPR